MPPPAPVEKPAISGMLLEGARALGLSLNQAQADALSWMAVELARWSSRINLTAILDPIEVGDKHILDSLSVLRALPSGPFDLLDAGTGAGFPGLPLAIAREDLTVTLVDSVAKKVGFLKHVIAHLGLASRVRAIHRTLQGNPAKEGLAPVDAAVSRALADPARWAKLADPYLRPGGTLVVMAGADAPATTLPGWKGPTADRFRLPLTGDGRTLLSYRKSGG
jgi:16S rRNA (guanine527-N7)-methyltransferase